MLPSHASSAHSQKLSRRMRTTAHQSLIAIGILVYERIRAKQYKERNVLIILNLINISSEE